MSVVKLIAGGAPSCRSKHAMCKLSSIDRISETWGDVHGHHFIADMHCGCRVQVSA